MVLLAIIALIVIPPEKLPDFARQLARFLNDIRRSTSGLWEDLKNDAALKPEDLNFYKSQPPNRPSENIATVDAGAAPTPVTTQTSSANEAAVKTISEDEKKKQQEEYLNHIHVDESVEKKHEPKSE